MIAVADTKQDRENTVNKTAQQKRLISMAVMAMLSAGLSGCADDASNLLGGTTSGTTGGTTGGTTAGTTAGTTGGTTSGTTAGTTAGTTGGTTSGTTAGTTGGTTSGTTAGTTGGTTSGTTAGTTGGTTSGTTAGTTGGTTSGTTAGTTGGTTAGTTGGTTSGTTAGTTGGTTAGTTGGTTSGTTGGTTSGTTGGTTGGTTTGGDLGGIVCNPLSDTFRPIQLPNATAVGTTSGICIGCTVGMPDNAIDADITTVASLNTPIGLLGASSQLAVVDTATLYPAGRRAGFVIFDPAGALLTATLLQTVTVSAVNNGVVQEGANFTTLSLDLLGTPIIGSTQPTYASFVPTLPFNELRISFGSTVNALAQLGVIQACVSVGPAVLP